MSEGRAVPVKDLILVPSLVTLAVTILRLVGELQDWSPALFSKAPGGGGALVGISWLIIVFGFYFGWRLTRMGLGTESPGKVAGLALLVVVAATLVTWAASQAGQNALFGAFVLSAIAAVTLTARLWPALWKTLVAYAFAARIPVALVALFGMLGNWGTHYDVAPPEFAASSTLVRWLLIGLLPQVTIWIYMTVLGGLVFGSIASAIARRR